MGRDDLDAPDDGPQPVPPAEAEPSSGSDSSTRTPREPSDEATAGASVDDSPSFGRFLYNHNPFYLISCLLVIYGCQDLAISGGSLVAKSLRMGGGIAAYTILMACVCVGVVRLAKVWEDARSILIVVVISLVALTTAFDELCIRDSATASLLSFASMAAVVLVSETVLSLCRIRLSFWYRLSYYALFLTLSVFPLLLGRAVADRNDALANWGSVLFSVASAACFALMIPAMRQGTRSISENGTPWTWPLYPLSAFVVLAVLTGIRAHALWISFGFHGVAGRLEPFLLLPLFAVAILILAETGFARGSLKLQRWALVLAPMLVFCGWTEAGMTRLPIQSELQAYCGSSRTLALLATMGLYCWMAARGSSAARIAVPFTLLAGGIFADMPLNAVQSGIDRWAILLVAAGVFAWTAFRVRPRDWILTAAAVAATLATANLGYSFADTESTIVATAAVATLSMLIIGACFATDLAFVHRCSAAAILSAATVILVVRSTQAGHQLEIYPTAVIALLSGSYALIVRRSGWLMVAAAQLLLFVAGAGYQGHRSGRLTRVNWPIASGLACVAVGVTITAGKAGFYQRLVGGGDKLPSTFRFRSGL